MRVRLSLCMIVRDEAAMLPGCLDALGDTVDEIVVVDTGSTDDTPGIAAAAGAKVIHEPWGDDFAAARNVALAHATGDTVLVLDADERLVAGAGATIRAALGRGVGAATLRFQNPLASGLVRESRLLRVFPRSPDIRFRHRIHEDPWESVHAWVGRTGRPVAHLDANVLHLGYQRDVATERNKRDRDWRLLSLLLTDDPDDLYAHYKRLQVARFWNDGARWAEAALAADAALARAPGALARLHVADDLLVMIARAPGGPHHADARAWLDAAAALVPATATLDFWRGHAAEEAGDLPAAAGHYTSALARSGARDPQFDRVRPRLGLARIALAVGDVAGAAELAHAATDEAPRDLEALALSVYCARVRGTLAETAAALTDRAGAALVRQAGARVGVVIPG